MPDLHFVYHFASYVFHLMGFFIFICNCRERIFVSPFTDVVLRSFRIFNLVRIHFVEGYGFEFISTER